MKRSFSFFFVLLLILVFIFSAPRISNANTSEAGAGDQTSSSPQIPPTTQGPGLLLPNSPLFFLDRLKQRVRLLLAFTPEKKARVYESVAGERLAELRFMLAAKNREGIYTDLQGIADNFSGAKKELALAKLSGKDVSRLAKEINLNIRQTQDSLAVLENEETGSMKDEVAAVQRSLFESKAAVEDDLPSQDLLGEIRDDLNLEVKENLDRTRTSVLELQKELDLLQKYSAGETQKKLAKEEEALKKALGRGNINLASSESEILRTEKSSQSAILAIQQQTVRDANDIRIKAGKIRQDLHNMEEAMSKMGVYKK